jgi:hypothetical protein
MSSPMLTDIQAGIKRALDSIDGLRAQATETDQAPGAAAPIAYPRVVDWTYDQSWEEGCDEVPTLWHFDIWVLVNLSVGLNRAQNDLNDLISPRGRRSVLAALARDTTLGGRVDYIRLTGGGAYGTSDVAGVRCLAASVRAEVQAP